MCTHAAKRTRVAPIACVLGGKMWRKSDEVPLTLSHSLSTFPSLFLASGECNFEMEKLSTVVVVVGWLAVGNAALPLVFLFVIIACQ